MSEQEVFILADQELNNVVQQIRDDQWSMTMPPDFQTRGGGEITLREVINYHAYDEAWVPDTLSGKTMEEVGKDNYQGDLLGENPKDSFAKLVESGCTAVRALDDLDKPVHLTYGEFPAREYLWHITSFRGLRVHDISKAVGLDTAMNPELVQRLWDELSPHADEWRQMGVFGPAVTVPDDASLQDRLLAMTGRQPK